MEIITRPTAEHAVELVVRIFEDRIKNNPRLVMGLATGRTMERVYARLAESRTTFKGCSTFNLDEYIGLAPDDNRSYRHYMKEHLFSKIDILPENTHLPDGACNDVKFAAQNYEALIKASGGIDVQLLGIGESGHIGFNEPLSAILSRTRDKTLTYLTRQQNAKMFGGSADQVPQRALTMGIGTILESRELLLLATGESKADILAQAVEGPITSMVSASAIQLHPNCKVILDEAAASQLKGREYYDFIFEHEPHWSRFKRFWPTVRG